MAIQQSTDGLRELSLFSGSGGGILAGHLLGWRTICAVERDAYAAGILAQRQNDGCLKPFPIWSDVTTFDGRPWCGRVDVISGGFPCQDLSIAGKGAGLEGEKSGLWREFKRIIGEVRPREVFIENSPMLAVRGLHTILCDLASMGFNARWGCLSGYDTGHETLGDRLWIVAKTALHGSQVLRTDQAANDYQAGPGQNANELDAAGRRIERIEESLGERAICGSADALAYKLDRFKAIGNGQDPFVAATAFKLLGGNDQ